MNETTRRILRERLAELEAERDRARGGGAAIARRIEELEQRARDLDVDIAAVRDDLGMALR